MTTTLRVFRDREEANRFVAELTTVQRELMAELVSGASALPDERQRLMFCRFSRRLFDARCDEANAMLAPGAEIALVDADIDALFPLVEKLVGSDLVVDLDALDHFTKAGRG